MEEERLGRRLIRVEMMTWIRRANGRSFWR